MDKRRGMMTSLLAAGATGAAIYGITKSVQNGTFKRMPQAMSNAMNNPQAQQFTKPLQNMMNNQTNQQTSGVTQGWENNTTQQSTNYQQND